ncbi:hypothetical protein GCM10027519_43260 [Kineococcus endophyticus]
MHDAAAAVTAGVGVTAAAQLIDWRERHRKSRAEMLLKIVQQSGVGEDSLAAMTEDPVRARTLGEALAGAESATFHAKIIALGKVLSDSANTVNMVEQRRLLDQSIVLGSLEELDVAVLDCFSLDPPQTIYPDERPAAERSWRWAALNLQLNESELKLGHLLAATLSRLVGQGLVYRDANDVDGEYWGRTGYGDKIMTRLYEARDISSEIISREYDPAG